MDEIVESRSREFLASWGVDMDSLARYAPPVAPGECLALVGSIVEGLANDQSDIDLLYLGEGELHHKLVIAYEGSYRFGMSHDEDGREINVEQLGVGEVEALVGALERSIQSVRQPKDKQGGIVVRDHDRMRMAHRILNSVPLVNAPVLESWRQRLRATEHHVWLCQGHVAQLLNLQEDILGELDAGELDSALWMTRARYLPTLVAAMIASVGETSQQAKWHYRLLLRHREMIGAADVDRVLASLAAPDARSREELTSLLLGVAEPVFERIYERHRVIRRSMTGLKHIVRYNDLRNPRRWTRPGNQLRAADQETLGGG
jgi:hypothetical protein